MEQIYENYTTSDQNVWKVLFDRQYINLANTATKEFLSGLNKIKFTSNRIPDFKETSKIVKKITGWELKAVPGIVDDKLFFELLASKRFPATTWIRKMQQLDYLEEPDMFHDVFAHIPLLTNQSYADFLQSLSKIALEHIDDQWAVHLLSRVYWYTVEFGLIRERGNIKIYGAGILSSVGESLFSLCDEPQHLPYDVEEILDSSYRKDTFQSKYFVINSYQKLYSSIDEIKMIMERKLAERTSV